MSTVVSTAAAPNAPVPDQEFETVSMVLHIFTKDQAQMPFAGDQISLRYPPARHQFLGWNNCTVDSASGQFVAQGSFLGWQYTISQAGRVVAAISKQGILPATFEVEVADGEDDLFLLCLVLAIEQIHRERRRRH